VKHGNTMVKRVCCGIIGEECGMELNGKEGKGK
jgi:hypothetical protein